MTLSELANRVRSGEIDTVLVGFPDALGRLVGKRYRAAYFLDHVVEEGTHACNYLLAVNMEMDPLDGFKVANWEAGFGDFALRPDPRTFRVLPWQTASALVICDYVRPDGSLVSVAPRSVLRRQLERAAESGWAPFCASELEFYLFNQSYEAAFANGYRDLCPSSDYRIDYHLMQPGRDEPIMREIRNSLTVAGVPIENSKGEWSRGQHEVNFVYTDPLEMADRHVVFKQGVKEIAAKHGKSVSFMAKYAPSEAGNSCHIHMSLWKDDTNLFAGKEGEGHSTVFRAFLGGLMKYSPELTLFFAPTINSYKRFQPGSWAPTRMVWSGDNRTTGFRVVGRGKSLRIENRMPGADANPYLAFAAMLAAGMAGLREKLDCGECYNGNAYVDTSLPKLPASLRDAADLLEGSAMAREAFGADVVEYYVHHARLEQQAFNDAVTDWERIRYFERI